MARTVKLAKFQEPGGFLVVPEDFGDFATQSDIDSAVSDHEAAADPHPGYVLESTLDADGTLAANSDAKVATQKAVKAYVDNAVTGLWDVKGGQDCSANPNYPAALKGDAYVVTVAGKIGGASGTSVDVGDVFVAFADNAGGDEAAVGSSWENIEHNLSGVALLAGGTFTGDISVPDEAYDATAWNGSLEVPTKNAVRDKIESLSAGGISSGSSNPGSPSTNDLFYRTDLALLIYYDGTRWLTVNEYSEKVNDANATIAATGAFLVRSPIRSDFGIYLTKCAATSYVVSGNTGAAGWALSLDYLNSADATVQIASTSTSTTPDANATWTFHTFAINAVLNSAARCFQFRGIKTGSPGALYAPATVFYRLIVT